MTDGVSERATGRRLDVKLLEEVEWGSFTTIVIKKYIISCCVPWWGLLLFLHFVL